MSSNQKILPPKVILQRLETLAIDSAPVERRKALLNAMLNLALIPEKDFVASQIKREDTLLAVYEEILVWEEG